MFKNEKNISEDFQELVKEVDKEHLTADLPDNLMEISIVMQILHIAISLAVPVIIIGTVFLCMRIAKWILELRQLCSSTGKEVDLEVQKLVKKISFKNTCCLISIRILMVLYMIILIIFALIIHAEITQRWINDDQIVESNGIRYIFNLKEQVDVNLMKPMNSQNVSNITNMEHQMINENEMDLMEFGENINNIYMDLVSKILAILFSFGYIVSSILSVWFLFNVIFNWMSSRMFLFCFFTFFCSVFLGCFLTLVYINLVIPYLMDFIHPSSDILVSTALQIFRDFFNALLFDLKQIVFTD